MSQKKSLSEVHESVNIGSKRGFWKTLLAFLGPAYMVSVGYMDPGNWATDIAGGSQFGYQLIWVLLMSNLMALLLQSLAARLGVVRGLDLAQASRQQYAPWANVSLYALAEIAIAACDLAEIIGMAIGLKLLFGLPLTYGVIITVLDTFLLLFLLNKGIRKMEVFIVSLIAIIGMSFIAEMVIVKPDLPQLAKGFIPVALTHESLYIAIGIIGATVMPHNLYLHSSLVQTRKFNKDEQGIKQALKFNLIDSTIALNLAFFVNAAILILAASAFHRNGLNAVSDIADAHLLLENLFGNLAPSLFAIALICAGQSSTITGTLAGQIVMEGYLNLRISPWIRRLLTRLLAILPALFTIFYFGEEKLGSLLVLSQVVLSMQLGFAVIPLIHFTSNKQQMKQFAISTWVKMAAWIAAAIIVTLNIKLVYEELHELFTDLNTSSYLWLKILMLIVVVFVIVLLVYIISYPFLKQQEWKDASIPHGEAVVLQPVAPVVYNHIAVTVDFSKHDQATIERAVSLGGKNANYLLIHIVESAGAIRLGSQILDNETLHDGENLKKYQQNLTQLGYQVAVQLGYGKSSKGIVDIIKQSDIQLLVMGAHGHQGIKDFIFGSTVDKVRHQVGIPVLIVK
jgi:manganese transport protein